MDQDHLQGHGVFRKCGERGKGVAPGQLPSPPVSASEPKYNWMLAFSLHHF